MTTQGDPTHHVHVEGSNVSSSREGEIDEEGYLIDQHHETEQFSHTREVRELDDHTEIMQHDSRCLQLEELKTKETVRLATAEELRALLEASVFDGKDEIEIGTEITVEGFVRVEQTHEETIGGGTTSRSVTVTETREKEEINETPTKSFDKTLRLEGNAPSDIQCQMQMEDLMRNTAIENNEIVRNADTLNENSPNRDMIQNGNTSLKYGDVDADEEVTKDAPVWTEGKTAFDTENNATGGQLTENKNRGFIGFIKERSRSLSRNRSDCLIKDEGSVAASGEKKKEKNTKKWSFGVKSSKKDPQKGSDSGKKDDAANDGIEGVEGNNPQTSAEDVKKDKKQKKRGLFGKRGESSCVGSGKRKSVPGESGHDEKSDSKNAMNNNDTGPDRGWSLFRRKSDKKKDTIETSPDSKVKVELVEGGGEVDTDSKRKPSTNSLQRGIRNIFSNKKESAEHDEEEAVNIDRHSAASPTTPLSNHGIDVKVPAAVAKRESSENYGSAISVGCSTVIAVDLGPVSCGYAYCFTKQRHPDNAADTIYAMRKPDGCDPGIPDPRFPTALLISPEGDFHSFGFTARRVYHSLEPTEAVRWMYLDDFRQVLANISVSNHYTHN